MFKKYQKTFLVMAFITALSCVCTSAQVPAAENSVADAAIDSVVTVLLAADGQSQAVGSGLIVRSDGHILVPYSLVRGAREIQIRMRNGETYDKAEIVAQDERRNIAILRINAVGLRIIPNGTAEETQVGTRMFVLANPAGQDLVRNDLMLNSVQMADSIQGAGKGYRLLQFDAMAGANAVGGLVLDERGRTLGIITTTPEIKGQSIAVPLSSLIGLIRSVPVANTFSTASSSAGPTPASYPASSQTPYPIPQSSVLVPQRGVTPLSAKGPGSTVIKPTTVPEILAVSKTIYVTSRTVFFKPDQLVNALNSKPEMADWNLSFVDERELADLILELDHVLFTYKFTFKLYSQRLGTVVATGSRIIFDGNLGAPYMADRVVEKLKAARGVTKKAPESPKETKKEGEKAKDVK